MSQSLTNARNDDNSHQELLVFVLGGEEYAVDILKVQEIRSYSGVTRIANVPPVVKGVINLRGAIVPVVDMRVKFELEQTPYDEFTLMIILNLADRTVGMIVDGVSDVILLSEDQIRPVPELGAELDADYITGIGVIEERMLILVDIEQLMQSEDMALVTAAA